MKCYMMIGLPGTGKSTLTEMIKRENDFKVFVYSTDNILEEIASSVGKTYDQVFKDNIKFAKKQADQNLASAIKKKKDVVWDQTNLSPKKRKGIIECMKRYGYDVKGICILPPTKVTVSWSVWESRLANRPGKTIPKNVLTSMINSYKMPSIDEGFESISKFDINGQLISMEISE